MPALLSRIVGSVFRRRWPNCEPVPFGARYSLDADGVFAVETGPLAGTRFRFDEQVTDRKADFAWFPPGAATADPAAHCHFDRDPDSGLETIWDIFIHADLRRKGFSSLMVRATFRRLLGSGRRHWFAMRKLMKVDTEACRRHSLPLMDGSQAHSQNPHPTTLQNVGIGVVALKLGFRPEPGLAGMLSPGNVTSLRLVEARPPEPPGLLVRLAGLPGVAVAVLLDPATGRPVTTQDYYERFFSPAALLRQAQVGEALVGNIDYLLPRENVESLAGRLADSRDEANRFAAVLRRSSKLAPASGRRNN